MALGSALVLTLIAGPSLADLYLRKITSVSDELAGFVVPGLPAALLLSGLVAFQSWLRSVVEG